MDLEVAPQSSNKRTLIKLNVGGCLFCTTLDTLTQQGKHMLSTMFAGSLPVSQSGKDEEGWIFIDRDGTQFRYILNFLREGTALVLPESRAEKQALLQEARYYALDALVAKLDSQLVASPVMIAKCLVPVITCDSEEQQYVEATRKGMPLVKLVYSRCNNKFSYTAVSDDALLRNIEMFDKLSLKFNGRIIYAKDTTGRSGLICTWFFYGHGRLISEVCCSSMVYQADKKLTKIEFPEARLFEENMNMLLFERPPNGDEQIDIARRFHIRASSPQ